MFILTFNDFEQEQFALQLHTVHLHPFGQHTFYDDDIDSIVIFLKIIVL